MIYHGALLGAGLRDILMQCPPKPQPGWSRSFECERALVEVDTVRAVTSWAPFELRATWEDDRLVLRQVERSIALGTPPKGVYVMRTTYRGELVITHPQDTYRGDGFACFRVRNVSTVAELSLFSVAGIIEALA
jgi:hypothetical protein